MNNPYRDSLAGLEIADPVKAFFDFCKERDAIHRQRASGQPPPWTQDVIFQRGRFLNVFREDDKGTKAVLRFAEPARASLPDLIHALFFARWCNRDRTLIAGRGRTTGFFRASMTYGGEAGCLGCLEAFFDGVLEL